MKNILFVIIVTLLPLTAYAEKFIRSASVEIVPANQIKEEDIYIPYIDDEVTVYIEQDHQKIEFSGNEVVINYE